MEQSIAVQYGILPSQQGDLLYRDWAQLVSGLMDDTPLGRVVAIRSETDTDVIARMSKGQKRIRQEWAQFRMTYQKKASDTDIRKLQNMVASMFGGRRAAHG